MIQFSWPGKRGSLTSIHTFFLLEISSTVLDCDSLLIVAVFAIIFSFDSCFFL